VDVLQHHEREKLMQRNGIAAGGTFVVDHTKLIDAFPEPEALAHILEYRLSNGGGPFNLLVDLARLEAPFPLSAIGCVGGDRDGRWCAERCREHGIDATRLRVCSGADTSFTDVMTERGSGRRTFFYRAGANALLDIDDFGVAGLDARLLYLGYPMVLDRLDAPHPGSGTRGAELLRQARAAGAQTCVDLVTAAPERFDTVVPPVLRHADLCLMNELEAERLTGLQLRPEGRLAGDRVVAAARSVLDRGVHRCVVIHSAEGAVAVTEEGACARRGSARIPPERIAGSAGAGDAFAAGFLLGWHEQTSLDEALFDGIAAATACLLEPTTSDGVRRLAECRELASTLGLRPAP
jgi:sugar/nucleoside kinase (ribokinase family)